MKVNVDGLEKHLNNQLRPVYLVTGDELLLVQESVDKIRRTALNNGFTDRSVFHVEGRFEWEAFLDDSASLSLFSEKKVIEVRFRKSASASTFKMAAEARKHLETYLTAPDENNLLIIEAPKLDISEQKKKWYQLADRHGAIVTIWPIDLNQFPAWITKRAQHHGLKLAADACQYLSEKVEGNLLAAAQEIDKLKFFSKGELITIDTVMDTVAESSRYRTFDLADACLKRDTRHALHIANGLLSEGVAIPLILGVLTRLIHQCIKIHTQIRTGVPGEQACYKAGVTNKKQQSTYLHFVRSLNPEQADNWVEQAMLADRAIKGNLREDPATHLRSLVISLSTLPTN